MKPASFEYLTPATLEEAAGLLEQHGDDAKVIAGGQSLVPLMNFRLVKPKVLIDINRVAGLDYIKESDGKLRIGAMTRQRTAETSPVIRQKNGLLSEAIKWIGHPAIRTRGTVGGSIAHADPTSELCTCLVALDGEVQVAGPAGKRRTVGWQDFFVTFFTTSLESGEICAEVVFPALPPKAGFAFEEFAHRLGDFAIAGVAAVVETDGNNRCASARLAISGAAPTPVRATAAEEFLKGKELAAKNLEEAGRLAAADLEPDADLHASAEYRKHLAAVLTTRALVRALDGMKAKGRK